MKFKTNFRVTVAIFLTIAVVSTLFVGIPMQKAKAVNLAPPSVQVCDSVYYFSDMANPTLSVSEISNITNSYSMIVYDE